jgi:Bacterial SH3 domain
MGQAESALSEQIGPPRSLAERLRAEVNGTAPSIEVTTATFMAERFAPDVSLLAANDADADGDAAPEPTPDEIDQTHLLQPALERASRGNIAVLVALTALALVPTLALGALYWRGAIDVKPLRQMVTQATASATTPAAATLAAATTSAGSTPLPVVQEAAVAPMSETVLPKADIELPPIGLALPDSISAEAGEETPFAIAIDEADTLPSRSIIAIRGLPQGATFSSGRPYGETEWTLRPDEIGDLRFTLPATASGERSLNVELVAADGRTIASASTTLRISSEPDAAAKQVAEDGPRIDELMAHGDKMIEVGYLAGARGYYRRAADAGSGEAAFALGTTYDPAFIREIGAQGTKPDMAQARQWYERAEELGDKDAHAKLLELDSRPAVETKPAPAAGDPEWIRISGTVNVRSAPTPQAETIKVAQQGARYQATGREGRWVQITDPKTAEVGWIYDRYAAPSDEPGR